MPRVRIVIDRVNCVQKQGGGFVDDDIYYVSTLLCETSPPATPRLEVPIPMSKVYRPEHPNVPSDTLEIGSGETLPHPDPVVFDSDQCSPDGTVIGSLYFFNKWVERDFPLRVPITFGDTYTKVWTVIGIVLAMIAASAAAAWIYTEEGEVVGSDRWQVLIATVVTFLGVEVVGEAIRWVINNVVSLKDDFVGGIPLRVPVTSNNPRENLPPENLSAQTSKRTKTTLPIATDSGLRFNAAKADVNYNIFLRVERS